ncbi:MAG: hypothetical protein MRY81_10055 [Donghicola eburneus]|nr:hypothetical protein [Donghicola eburneus]MCI5040015.1 hypothetical protein [Donghicola eburneus]
MSFTELTEKASQSLVGWLVASIAAGVLWTIRRVFTNQKQIEMLQREIKSRDDLRQRDREDVKEVKADVKELHNDIKGLLARGGSHGR